ncbi:MAG: hypothetical protein JWQ98_1080 [Chlorobi bacterium]|nr:hypothetical protein [Chlorobiota bacterium]
MNGMVRRLAGILLLGVLAMYLSGCDRDITKAYLISIVASAERICFDLMGRHDSSLRGILPST